jgi:hypothetical protein
MIALRMASGWRRKEYRTVSIAARSSSMLHAIGNGQVTALEDLAIEQLKVDLPCHRVKERDA